METTSNAELLSKLREIVQRARPGLDTGQGVKMLYSDLASLSNQVWTVGLNPGGSHAEPDQWCREDGAHDYRDGYRNQAIADLRPGGRKLRRQLKAMVEWLGLDWDQTLSLNLVPFRCAKWGAQPKAWRDAAIEFAEHSFWPALLEHMTPRLVVAFGADSAKVLRRVFGHGAVVTYLVNWGNVTADVSSDGGTTILRLPHLSTFGIFDRPDDAGRGALDLIRRDESVQGALAVLRPNVALAVGPVRRRPSERHGPA